MFILGGRETMEDDRKESVAQHFLNQISSFEVQKRWFCKLVCLCSMKMLLKRFRLEIEDIVVITDVDKPPLAKK